MNKDLESIQEARDLAEAAYRAFQAFEHFTEDQVEKILAEISKVAIAQSPALAKLAVEETGYGNVEHKTLKNLFCGRDVYEAIKPMKTVGIVREDPEKKIFGVVLSNGSRYLDLQIYSDVIMNRIGKIMAGEEFKPLASLNFVKLQPVAYSNIGTYRLENGDEFRITLREGGLLLEPFGQSAAMALGQFPKANPGQLSAINEKAKPVIEGILKKDYTAFKSNIADGATFDRLKGVLEQRISEWEKSDGPIKLLTVAGTVPAWWTDEQMPTTFVNVQMEKRSRLFRLNWKEGKITNIGGAGIPAPILIQMLPTSQTDFLGWQIVTSRPNAVRFSPDGKTVSVTADGRTTIAKKVE